LKRILIFSDNDELVSLCKGALTLNYQIKIVNDLASNLTADLTLVDADKLTENKTLLSLFNTKTTRFLILGNNWTDEQQIEALVHGAAGYCTKTVSSQILLLAIESVLKGDVWIQRHLVSKVIGVLVQLKSSAVPTDTEQNKVESVNLILSLSNRELDVAKMISQGVSNKEIASSLCISERTVKAHLTSIFKKLHVTDRLHLALFIKEFN